MLWKLPPNLLLYPPEEVTAAAWGCAAHPRANTDGCFYFIYAAERLCLAVSQGSAQPSSCGEKGFPLPAADCPRFAPCPALLHHSWTGRWRGNVKFVRGADFAPGRYLLPSRLKSNVCSPVASSNLLHSPGSSLVLHRLVWKSCMFWRGGVRV